MFIIVIFSGFCVYQLSEDRSECQLQRTSSDNCYQSFAGICTQLYSSYAVNILIINNITLEHEVPVLSGGRSVCPYVKKSLVI